MVRLINIKQDKTVIEADFIPEDSEISGHIVLDKATQDYKADEVKGFDGIYARMAANGLIKELKENTGETTRLVMWY